MTCAEMESLICDYADGTLGPDRKAEVERHLAGCAACAETARDAAAVLGFIERAADVEPPPELVTRILFDPPWAKPHPRASDPGFWSRWRALWHPVLQPRLAMGMAMTILSFAMLVRFVAPVRQLTPKDMDPAAVWRALDDRAYRAWQRTVKFYESMRLVYQIQTTVQEWQQQQDSETAIEADATGRKADSRRVPVRAPDAPAGGKSGTVERKP
jgi:hypothetical protein